jgi:hypothetical protein
MGEELNEYLEMCGAEGGIIRETWTWRFYKEKYEKSEKEMRKLKEENKCVLESLDGWKKALNDKTKQYETFYSMSGELKEKNEKLEKGLEAVEATLGDETDIIIKTPLCYAPIVNKIRGIKEKNKKLKEELEGLGTNSVKVIQELNAEIKTLKEKVAFYNDPPRKTIREWVHKKWFCEKMGASSKAWIIDEYQYDTASDTSDEEAEES